MQKKLCGKFGPYNSFKLLFMVILLRIKRVCGFPKQRPNEKLIFKNNWFILQHYYDYE